MFEQEQVVDGNAAALEMQATPKLEEESPPNIRMLSSEESLGSDQAKPESEHASTALEVQGEDSDEELDKEEQRLKRLACSVKIIIGLLLLGCVVFIIIDTTTNGYVKDSIESFLEWIEDHPIGGVFLFMVGTCTYWFCMFVVASAVGMVTNLSTLLIVCTAVYFAATVLLIPASILTLGAGFVFAAAFGLGGGIILGILSVFIGACLGAITSFLLGHYLLRDCVHRLTKKYTIFEALDAALQQNGLKIFLLLRLSPIIPFNAINYIGGVSAVSFRDYVLALFGMLPGTILYIFFCASAGSLTDSSSSGDNFTVTIIVVVIGVVFGTTAIWLSARYARKELNRIVQEREAVADADTETGDESGAAMQDVYLATIETDVASSWFSI